MAEEVADVGAVGGNADTAPATTTEQNPAAEASSAAAAEAEAQGTAKQESQATETEEAEEGLVGDGKEESEEGETQSAPESYSFEKLNVPEGCELDEECATELGKVAKKLGINQEGFETLFNTMAPVLERQQAENLKEAKRAFIAQGKADKEIGGAKWNETKTLARKALFKFTDPETRSVLQASGLDCHPGIIRAFRNIQLAISDDHVVRGQPSGEIDAAKAFFNNSKMN